MVSAEEREGGHYIAIRGLLKVPGRARPVKKMKRAVCRFEGTFACRVELDGEPPSTPSGRAVDQTTKHFKELREISLRSVINAHMHGW